MSDVLEPALAPIRAALRRLATRLDAKPTLRQGTVTSVGPVRVQLDGDTAPTPLTPRLLAPVAPGDRVTVAHTARDLTILGVIGAGRQPFAQAAGFVSVQVDSGSGDAEVPLPAGRFTRAPRVSLTPITTTTAITMWAYYGSTSTGFTIRVYRSSPGGATFSWHAIQMTATSADG